MANLDDLPLVSITDMQVDDALETLRQIRLSRRIPTKRPTKTVTTKKAASSPVNADQAAKLLEILGGSK